MKKKKNVHLGEKKLKLACDKTLRKKMANDIHTAGGASKGPSGKYSNRKSIKIQDS